MAVGRFQALSCPALKQFVSVAMARPLAAAVACQSVLVGFLSVSMAPGRWRAVSPLCLLPPCLLQRYDNHACHAISQGVKIYANGCIRRCRRGCYVVAGCSVALACISACGAGLCRGWRRRPAKRAVWGGRTARFAGRGRRAGPPDKHRVLKRTGSQGVGEQWHYSMNCFRS